MTTRLGLALLGFVLLLPVRAACQSLLILPFENRTVDPQLEWVGDALPELLAERLNAPGRYVITREEWVNAAERMGLPSSSHFSRGTMVKLGEELDASELILGEFEGKHGILWVTAKILDFRSLSLSPAMTSSGPTDELVTISTKLAQQLARQMDPTLEQAGEKVANFPEAIPLAAVKNLARSFRSASAGQQARFLREALRAAPGYLPAVFHLALAMYHQKDLSAAVAGFSKIPAENQRYSEANFYLGLSYLELKDPAKAEAAFLEAAQRAPVVAVFNNLAVAAARLADGKKAPLAAGQARAYLSRAREMDPGNSEVLFNSGLNAWRAGDAAEAARWLREAVQENPQDVLARRLLTAAQEKLPPGQDAAGKEPPPVEPPKDKAAATEKELAAADRVITEWDETAARFAVLESEPGTAPASRPTHEDLHLRRGQEALARGDLENARQELSRALMLDPNSFEAHYSLGEVYRRLRRPADAIRELKAALFGRNSVEARLLLANVYLDEQKWTEAEAQAKNVLRLDASNKEAQELLALAVARSRLPRQERGPSSSRSLGTAPEKAP